MGVVDVAYVCAIAVMYYMFTTRSVRYLTEEKIVPCESYLCDIDAECGKKKNDEYKACLEKASEVRSSNNSRVFRITVLIAVATLVLSSCLQTGLVGSALSLGSLIIILRSTISEWSKLGEVGRLLALGIGLSVAIYGASRYRDQNLFVKQFFNNDATLQLI